MSTPSSLHHSPSSSTVSLHKPPVNDQHSSSLLGHLSYPVSYTVSGLLRRISADEAPTPLARALSANYNGSLGEAAPTHPIPRRLSPFQPPPLTPLSLTGRKRRRSSAASASSAARERDRELLGRDLAEEIRLLLPPRLQLVDQWRLTYSLEQDGTSLASLYAKCEEHKGKRGGFVLAVRDGSGGIFGAYLSDPPRPHPHYYGTGECLLWRCTRTGARDEEAILSSLPPPPSEDTTNLGRSTTLASPMRADGFSPSLLDMDDDDDDEMGEFQSAPRTSLGGDVAHALSTDQQTGQANGTENGVMADEAGLLRFQAFPYTGDNDFTILCGATYLSVGGGGGKYGLWLDDRMAKGVSDTCPTFANEPLCERGVKFDVLGVELWYVGA